MSCSEIKVQEKEEEGKTLMAMVFTMHADTLLSRKWLDICLKELVNEFFFFCFS